MGSPSEAVNTAPTVPAGKTLVIHPPRKTFHRNPKAHASRGRPRFCGTLRPARPSERSPPNVAHSSAWSRSADDNKASASSFQPDGSSTDADCFINLAAL